MCFFEKDPDRQVEGSEVQKCEVNLLTSGGDVQGVYRPQLCTDYRLHRS